MFTPSPQKLTILDWVSNGKGSAVVKAVAGSGKTTTLVDAVDLMQGRIFFGAYNKAIATEIAEKTGSRPGLFVQTMHAAGFSSWRKAAPMVKVDGNKCRDLYRAMAERLMAEAQQQYEEDKLSGQAPAPVVNLFPFEPAVLRLVSYAKQSAFGVKGYWPMEDYNGWLTMIDHFDVDTLGEDEQVIELSISLLKLSIENDTKVIDFDDMIYAPLIHNSHVWTYDWVLVDEAQDTNAARRALALRMVKQGGRLIAVGDPHQAIYGFTGADADSMELIANAVNAVELPLTVSYRCPKAVVKYAQNWVSHIQSADNAPEGEVCQITVPLASVVKPGDAVLCRFNAPVVEYAFQLIAAGIAAKVEGREIGAGLKALTRQWKVADYDALLTKLDDYCEKQVQKYLAKEQKGRAEGVKDRVRCLQVLIARAREVNPAPANPADVVCEQIDLIFGENVGKDVVLLSSIHKSKGREWKKVFWLQTGVSKWARKDWEKGQEDNLCYVAATRAKQSLFLIDISRKGKQ